MKRIIAAAQLLALVLAAPSCVQRAEPPAAQPAPEPTPAPAPERAQPRAPERAPIVPVDTSNPYAVMLEELLPGMGAENIVDREQSQQKFEEVCLRAGRPGAEAERLLLCRAMLARLGPATAKPARVWMLRQLERISGAESAGQVAELLDDPDPQIREPARRVLQNDPAPIATAALCAALSRSSEPAWRVALINALAARRDPAGLKLILPLAQADDPVVAAAALAALGDLGGPEALKTLHLIWRREDGAVSERAGAAMLRVVEGLLGGNKHSVATAIFREVYNSDSGPELRIAALHGLVAAEPDKALSTLLPLIRDDADPRMQSVAARLAEGVPGDTATRALMAEFERGSLSPRTQALILDVLAARGDAQAREVVLSALEAGEREVRIAAVRAMGRLGDPDDVKLLGGIMAEGQGPEHEAAREVLAQLPGAGVDQTIIATIGGEGDDDVRAALARSVADRFYDEGVPALLTAAQDRSETVRLAAFESLGKLTHDAKLPKLVALLVGETSGDVRQAAEDAVVAVAARLAERDERAAPVLEVLGQTSGAARASLIRVLGRIQGAAALAAIRAARQEQNEQVVDAAVRALADWQEPVVLDDLLEVARGAGPQAHRVLALRGYVRLVRSGERPAQETFDLLKAAMPLAGRAEEKRLILSAATDAPCIDALDMARSHLEDAALCNEAAVATVALARGLAAEHPEAARGALDEILGGSVADSARDQARAAVEMLEQFEGYSAAWLYAGPFSLEGGGFDEVFNQAFPAESSAAGSTEWRPLTVGTAANAWIYDLTRIDEGGNRCIYVKTMIWSGSDQPARLEIGSDDGVRAWLNGRLVHSNPAQRGLTPAQDKVDVTLNEGWNTLLLKVVQGSGGWGFTCGVRAPDGAPLPGLKFKAE